jgi:hypothetical protein
MDVLVKIWLSFVISMKYVRCVKIWPFEWNSDFRWSFVWNIINVWKYGNLSKNLTFIGHLCEISSNYENMVIWVKIWLSLIICVKYGHEVKIWLCLVSHFWWKLLNQHCVLAMMEAHMLLRRVLHLKQKGDTLWRCVSVVLLHKIQI